MDRRVSRQDMHYQWNFLTFLLFIMIFMLFEKDNLFKMTWCSFLASTLSLQMIHSSLKKRVRHASTGFFCCTSGSFSFVSVLRGARSFVALVLFLSYQDSFLFESSFRWHARFFTNDVILRQTSLEVLVPQLSTAGPFCVLMRLLLLLSSYYEYEYFFWSSEQKPSQKF